MIIIALIPLALKGIAYKPLGAAAILRRNLLIYGVGGVLAAVRRHQGDRRGAGRGRPGLERVTADGHADQTTDGRRAAGAHQGAGARAAAHLHRRRAGRRQDLRDAAGGARAARPRPRRRRRLSSRPTAAATPSPGQGPRGRSAPQDRVPRRDDGGDGRRRHHPSQAAGLRRRRAGAHERAGQPQSRSATRTSSSFSMPAST